MEPEDKLQPVDEILAEEETLEQALPFNDYGKEMGELRRHIEKLEKDYNEREKVIDRIMEYGTGIETEKALRMYPISLLRKWDAALENYRKSQLKGTRTDKPMIRDAEIPLAQVPDSLRVAILESSGLPGGQVEDLLLVARYDKAAKKSDVHVKSANSDNVYYPSDEVVTEVTYWLQTP